MGGPGNRLSFDHLTRDGKAGLARALAEVERVPDAPATLALLDAAFAAPRARVIGVTGPPGVGKSTLLGRLIARFRAARLRVGVIAVDPSSKRSGGALLGDRVRISTDPSDPDVFVRSMAARDRLGGLAEVTIAAMVLMRALHEVVLIETVGVGQSETDVAGVVDTVVFCVQPGSGDSLQFMKAGIVEIPHIAVVTKADLTAAAQRALADLKGAIALAADGPAEAAWPIEVLSLSAEQDRGIGALLEALERRAAWLARDGRLAALRQAQAQAWLQDRLATRFGQAGLERARARALDLTLPPGASPFSRLSALAQELAP